MQLILPTRSSLHSVSRHLGRARPFRRNSFHGTSTCTQDEAIQQRLNSSMGSVCNGFTELHDDEDSESDASFAHDVSIGGPNETSSASNSSGNLFNAETARPKGVTRGPVKSEASQTLDAKSRQRQTKGGTCRTEAVKAMTELDNFEKILHHRLFSHSKSEQSIQAHNHERAALLENRENRVSGDLSRHLRGSVNEKLEGTRDTKSLCMSGSHDGQSTSTNALGNVHQSAIRHRRSRSTHSRKVRSYQQAASSFTTNPGMETASYDRHGNTKRTDRMTEELSGVPPEVKGKEVHPTGGQSSPKARKGVTTRCRASIRTQHGETIHHHHSAHNELNKLTGAPTRDFANTNPCILESLLPNDAKHRTRSIQPGSPRNRKDGSQSFYQYLERAIAITSDSADSSFEGVKKRVNNSDTQFSLSPRRIASPRRDREVRPTKSDTDILVGTSRYHLGKRHIDDESRKQVTSARNKDHQSEDEARGSLCTEISVHWVHVQGGVKHLELNFGLM